MPDTPSNVQKYSVSDLNQAVKTLLDSTYDWVLVEGEVGDFTAASSGHWYFSLKDSHAQVRCAMFRTANQRVRSAPSRGDLVRVRARVTLYAARGEFQLICEHMAPAGDGALQVAFLRLKNRLSAEGLFDSDRKQSLPTDATRIGVITSATGAAIHDILSVLARRSPRARIYLYPVPVQGASAADAIAAAIEQANTECQTGRRQLQVLIVGRGGGSLEDLWAFNEERVARAIAGSNLPVVSAVGHEVDFSIADFVADERAATPTAAAELITQDQREWQQRLDAAQEQLDTAIGRTIGLWRRELDHLSQRLRDPRQHLAQLGDRISNDRDRLTRLMRGYLQSKTTQLDFLQRDLNRSHPETMLTSQQAVLTERNAHLQLAVQHALQREREALSQSRRLLQSLGPESTLARGYAVVRNEAGQVVRSAADAPVGAGVSIALSAGRVDAQITARHSE